MHNQDLYTRKFTIQELEDNIDLFSLKSILYTQTITAEFAVKYILTTDKYALCVEETYYDIDDVLALQPHLTREEIIAVAKREYEKNLNNQNN